MIKRYILHIEAHRNVFRYRPRISFKRAPRQGDRVVDGGIPGTLKLCPTCQEGFLHEPDPVPLWKPARKKSPSRAAQPPLLGLIVEDLFRNMAKPRPYPTRSLQSEHRSRPAMDFNAPTHVEIKTEETKPEAEHVELKLDETEETAEHVELNVIDEDVSPETLELDYKLGTVDHKRNDVLWTHKAEYIVDKLENDVLYLVRKDVWDERKKKAKKKAKHVEIKVDEPAEHVELKETEQKAGEIVKLKFE